MLNYYKIISDFLSAKGIISAGHLEQARALQQKSHLPIDDILHSLGASYDDTISVIIEEQLGMLVSDAADLSPEPAALARVEPSFALRHRLMPLSLSPDRLVLAIDTPLNFLCLEFFSRVLGMSVEGMLITRDSMDALLAKYFPQGKAETIQYVSEKDDEAASAASAEEAPVIQLVNKLISDAYQRRASDIHIEPLQDRLRVRFRIDGVLQEIPSPERRLQPAIISRLKLMSGMNIAEKRLPQDGRIRTTVEGQEFDLRVSTLPAAHGESVVLRILDRRALSYEEIGLSGDQQAAFRRVVDSPHGIVLVTGPTGSGKSTTLYAVLNGVDRARKKILTAEDPVEYQINGINQVQVRQNIGLSFSAILRSMLRQAPDIIMVGEIRDLETAQIAVQSALTGHLIFSTLHTNDAPGAVTRLVDMGIEPFLVAATLQSVLAQRLIRLLCLKCRQAYHPPKDERRILEPAAVARELYRAEGCAGCAHTGYLGRTGIFELLQVDDSIRELIHKNAAGGQIRQQARREGMMTLKEHATQKVLQGVTTFQELVRITQNDID
ncbi:MAG: GspE/PulE family protein [Candidatus Omnitrophica bacterium]|nr:GspE/PulE family protein [Candidatus Omnitrophota bacterium]